MEYKLFMIVAILIVMSGCGKGSPNIDYLDYQRQTEEHDRTAEKIQRVLHESIIEYRRQLDESAKQLERTFRQSCRYDNLLKRYEEQAERWDLILYAQEKALKINNQKRKQGQAYELDY